MRAHQEDEPQEETSEESSNVRKVINVREDANGEVDGDDD